MDGLSLSNMSKALYGLLRQGMRLDQDNYPEIMSAALIINTGMAFSVVWAIIKHFLDEKTQKSLTLVKRNADRLKKLVNQILDIRKIEAGGEKLRIQKYDIVKFCNQIKNQFKDEALKRNIFLQFSSENSSKIMWFDIEKVEKILFNLLSNAFKSLLIREPFE